MIKDVLEITNIHLKRAKSFLKEIENFGEISSDTFEDYEKIKVIDSFIYRFVKLQDSMGERLFKYFLDLIGEYRDNMSLIDVLDKLEKLEIINNSKDWMNYRKIRNKLTHEYPNNYDELIDGIKLSMSAFYEIEKIYVNIFNYIDSRNLLKELSCKH